MTLNPEKIPFVDDTRKLLLKMVNKMVALTDVKALYGGKRIFQCIGVYVVVGCGGDDVYNPQYIRDKIYTYSIDQLVAAIEVFTNDLKVLVKEIEELIERCQLQTLQDKIAEANRYVDSIQFEGLK